jgi:hypothetical protein
MKLKHQIAAIAIATFLAGCTEKDQMSGQQQSDLLALTNTSGNSASSQRAPAPPAVAQPVPPAPPTNVPPATATPPTDGADKK